MSAMLEGMAPPSVGRHRRDGRRRRHVVRARGGPSGRRQARGDNEYSGANLEDVTILGRHFRSSRFGGVRRRRRRRITAGNNGGR